MIGFFFIRIVVTVGVVVLILTYIKKLFYS